MSVFHLMKKPRQQDSKPAQNADAPSCDAYLVTLDTVRQVQLEIASLEELLSALAKQERRC